MATIVLRTFQFHIRTADNEELAQFSEVSGFDVTYDPVEYRAGDSTSYTTQKFPGLAKYGNVTLKRGILVGDSESGTDIDSNMLFEWISQNINGTYKKKDLYIDLYDPATNQTGPVATWHLINAWPTKYTGPDLKAQAAELAMETLELAHEGCERIAPGTTGGNTPAGV